jgi:hypothetical protein|tara:strand:+ start:3827 stop:4300 length:474 start_codon:yes stop_codon:yes gene_type:complete
MYDRSDRQKQTQEFFTQKKEVNEVLNQWPDKDFIKDQTWIDTSCGSGNILVGIFKRLEKFHNKQKILNDLLFGCDIEILNVKETIQRLFGNKKINILQNNNIPNKMKASGLIACYEYDNKLVTNFVCCDSLLYPMNFGRFIEPKKIHGFSWLVEENQ